MGTGRSEDEVIFVDLGAFDGRSTRLFERHRNVRKAYLWECHPDIQIKPPKCDHEIIRAAAWTHDGEVTFYPGEHQGKVTQGSSLLESKMTGWLDKDNPLTVPCMDLAAWLSRLDRQQCEVAIKMNVEGAEYELLPHALEFPTEWHISWHAEKVCMPQGTDESWRYKLSCCGYSPIGSPFPGHEGWRR
jgi:FkbM family methyltransferase